MAALNLTAAETEQLRVTGVTFAPLARGRFRCNQLPRLGRLRKAECDALRAKIHPPHRPTPTIIAQEPVPRRFTSYYDKLRQRPPAPAPVRLSSEYHVTPGSLGGINCPKCRWLNYVSAGRNMCTNDNCDAVLIVSESQPARRSVFVYPSLGIY